MDDYWLRLQKPKTVNENSTFAVERVVEETDRTTLDSDYAFSSQFYSPYKARKFLQSIIIKARKLQLKFASIISNARVQALLKKQMTIHFALPFHTSRRAGSPNGLPALTIREEPPTFFVV
ncbi:MAG TPA: hypothetical protein H9674_03725 [Firmicutes bacterium]|nr:hypothetical protein [Bacillota bacterium]